MYFNEIPKNIIISSKRIIPLNGFNKYKLENNIEDPNMKFSEKDSQIKMELINKIELKTLFEQNNNLFLQKVLDNLVCAKYYKSDFDEDYKFKLFNSLQNSLNYLIEKKKRLVKINNDSSEYYNKLNKQTNTLQKKLEENNIIIEEKSKIKIENKLKYEKLRKKYEEMKEKKEKIEKNNYQIYLEKNINTNIIQKENKILDNESNIQEIKKKYYCEVCLGKFFLSQESLEDHQIKRHPFITIRKPPKKKEKNINDKYSTKIESMKTYFQSSYDNYKKAEKLNESLEEIVKKRKEDNIKFENILKSQEKIIEDVKSGLEHMAEGQNKFINDFILISGLKKGEKQIKEEKKKKKNI